MTDKDPLSSLGAAHGPVVLAVQQIARDVHELKNDLAENCQDTKLIRDEILGTLGDDRPGIRQTLKRHAHEIEQIKRTLARKRRVRDALLITALTTSAGLAVETVWRRLSSPPENAPTAPEKPEKHR